MITPVAGRIILVKLPKSQSVAKLYKSTPLPHRKTMQAMRLAILEIAPSVEEVVSYGMPAFRLNGSIIAGLKAAKNHVGYYPFSGSVLPLFTNELSKYSYTKSAIHVPIDKPLTKSLLKKLIVARISQCPVKNGKMSTKKYLLQDNYWKSIGLAAPARRGLVDMNLLVLRDLTKLSEIQLREIHAVGPNATRIIKAELKKKGLKLKAD
jgi:uncharacterized protein YdhG (YjbR/CyaY superfamily)